MKSAAELYPTAHYVRVLRPLLPPEAFRPHMGQLYRATFHFGIYLCGLLLLRHYGSIWWAGLLCALMMGHSTACCAFIAHDISHGAVVKDRTLRRILEMLLWGINAIPPTLWHAVHNQTHHAETNTLGDTDRRFVESERTLSTTIYVKSFLPGRKRGAWWLSILGEFVFLYVIRHGIAAFSSNKARAVLVTAKPTYSNKARRWICVEILTIIGFQIATWKLVCGNLPAYLWASVATYAVASSVGMLYIFTNHSLNPLCEHTDPLVGSTSVCVPRWMDWLHDNFSYHTEHHVFPGMNPRYFPEVCRLLSIHFPERYNRISLAEAWRQLRQLEDFLPDPPHSLARERRRPGRPNI